jgi:transketolase
MGQNADTTLSRAAHEAAAARSDQAEHPLLASNTIRTLPMDAVQKANSGHPGTAMALAPVVYTIWQDALCFDPARPLWPNRDLFVLSAGHASMQLYSMPHLASVRAVNPKYETLGRLSVTLGDIKHFRQLDSRTPGHPEYRWTSGVETTTGPQALAQRVEVPPFHVLFARTSIPKRRTGTALSKRNRHSS